METWRRIDTWDAPPELNMGLDEALLAIGPQRPTLRFYTWRPDTLSLGYFQRLADVPGRERASALVRRITGGGAIHHVGELTYSLTAPADHPLFRGPVADSYARLHAAIAEALSELGVAAGLRGDARLTSEREGTGMCFHHSTALDLCWAGAKGVGSAQRRTGGRVLHHGSIKLAGSELETGVATLPGTDPAACAELVAAAFTRRFGAALEAGSPAPEELEHAYRQGPVYASSEFLARR